MFFAAPSRVASTGKLGTPPAVLGTPQAIDVKPGAELLMMFDATCPICKATLRMNSIYAGTSRTCSSCGAAFVLDLPPEVRAEVERRRPARSTARTMRLGCDACMRTSMRRIEPDERVVPCNYCGARRPIADALGLGTALEVSERQTVSGMLAGEPPAASLQALATAGWGTTNAQRLFAKCVRDLPFVRCHLWRQAQSAATGYELSAPAVCDLCPGPGPDPRRPLLALWTLVYDRETSISPWTALTIFAGAAVFETKKSSRELHALYFVCAGCRRRLTGLFQRFDGYPADQGYKVAKLREL